jgi:tRNA(fMet)-specific endonuclease VapC
MKYLLDTNICIYLFKGKYNLNKKIEGVGLQNIAVSEITYAELIYGAEKSDYPERNSKLVESFTNRIIILPIIDAIQVFAKEKARLRKAGNIISDFDLLIGATAIANNMVLVTRNVSEFERLHNIQIENWAE